MWQPLELDAELLAELLELDGLLEVNQGDDGTLAAGARRAASAVLVDLRALREVEVDDVVDGGDVEAARREVRRQEQLGAAALDGGDGRLARLLGILAEKRLRADALVAQLRERLLGRERPVDEDEAALDRQGTRELAHALDFLAERYGDEVMMAGGHLLDRRLDLYALRMAEERSAVARLLRVGRREHQGLAVCRQQFYDIGCRHVVLVVEQAVELVEHEEAHARELELALARELTDAAARADDELRFLLELVDLARDVRAADEALHADAEACLLAELARLASDLHRQLIRRGQHDGLCLAAVLVELHEDGQQVGERLARARRRHAEDVRASEDFRDGLLLDGRRLLDILVGEDSCECLADA